MKLKYEKKKKKIENINRKVINMVQTGESHGRKD
jgi:hypothetical protein